MVPKTARWIDRVLDNFVTKVTSVKTSLCFSLRKISKYSWCLFGCCLEKWKISVILSYMIFTVYSPLFRLWLSTCSQAYNQKIFWSNWMKWGVGPNVTFHEGGKVGRSNATPIKILTKFSKNVFITRKRFDGSGITPSYFPSCNVTLMLLYTFVNITYRISANGFLPWILSSLK